MSVDAGFSRFDHSRTASGYPLFLSLQETLSLHLQWILHGLVDASRWDIVLRVVWSDPEIRANILKSAMLNSLSLVTIYTFDLIIVPLLGRFTQEKWLHRNLGSLYQIIFQLPVVAMSLYLNSTWSTVVAKRVYTLQHGRAPATPTLSYTGLLTSIASSAYRWILITSTVIATFFLGYVPVVGPLASFIFMCWVNAYYYFEYIWVARGISFQSRVRRHEERWSYFFAFGFTSAAVCMWGSSLANAALFALLFPGYVIMAMHAHPLPTYPYAPTPPRTNAATGEERVVHPSPLVPVRIPMFAPVIAVNDAVLKILSGLGGGGRVAGVHRSRKSWDGSGDAEAEMEGVEEGLSTSRRPGPSRTPLRTRSKKTD